MFCLITSLYIVANNAWHFPYAELLKIVSLYLIKHHVMNIYWEWRYSSTRF